MLTLHPTGIYKKFNSLKKVNPRLKTIIAIGGWNEGSIKYSEMASTDEGRKKFAQSVVAFLDRHGFDGLDMDWEYPTQRGGNNETDRDNFVLLLRVSANSEIYRIFQRCGRPAASH